MRGVCGGGSSRAIQAGNDVRADNRIASGHETRQLNPIARRLQRKRERACLPADGAYGRKTSGRLRIHLAITNT